MKRLIVVVVATVFCVSLFCPPLAAMDHDPTKPLPWIANLKNPSGDDVGWGDPNANALSPILDDGNLLKYNLSSHLYRLIVVNVLSQDDNLNSNGKQDITTAGSSRGPSSN